MVWILNVVILEWKLHGQFVSAARQLAIRLKCWIQMHAIMQSIVSCHALPSNIFLHKYLCSLISALATSLDSASVSSTMHGWCCGREAHLITEAERDSKSWSIVRLTFRVQIYLRCSRSTCWRMHEGCIIRIIKAEYLCANFIHISNVEKWSCNFN